MKNKYRIIKKIRKNGTSLAINIPQEITELMDLREGELVEIEIRKVSK